MRAVIATCVAGSVGSLATVCSPGKLGFVLVHLAEAVEAFVIVAVPPVASGMTSAPPASFWAT